MYLGKGRWMKQFSSNNSSEIYSLLQSAKTLMWFHAAFNIILIHEHIFTNTLQLYKVKQKTYGYKMWVGNQILHMTTNVRSHISTYYITFCCNLRQGVTLMRQSVIEFGVNCPPCNYSKNSNKLKNKKIWLLLFRGSVMWDEASVLLGHDTTLYTGRTQAMLDHVRYVLCNRYHISD
jgi:hypothetical protein